MKLKMTKMENFINDNLQSNLSDNETESDSDTEIESLIIN